MILVVVTEVPNDETAATIALGTAMHGNVRTMARRAFGREEMDKIVGSLVVGQRCGDARPA